MPSPRLWVKEALILSRLEVLNDLIRSQGVWSISVYHGFPPLQGKETEEVPEFNLDV